MSLAVVEDTSEHEKEIGESVQVLNTVRRQALFGCERDDTAFGSTAYRARQMAEGAGPAAAWQNELLERREARIVMVERALEARDVLRLDAIVSWNRQLAAELEQDMLNAGEQVRCIAADRLA